MTADFRELVATAIYQGGDEPEWYTTYDGTANSASYELADRAIEAIFPAYLTVDEVAERVRVSKMTIYRMVQSGELPGIKFGRSFRIKVDDLVNYLESHRTGS